MNNIVSNIKNISIVILLTSLLYVYYNYNNMKSSYALVQLQNKDLLAANKQNEQTINLLKEDRKKVQETIKTNIQRKHTVKNKSIVVQKQIDEISKITDETVYEKEINKKYEEITKCIVSC